jgi:hypothetical protein
MQSYAVLWRNCFMFSTLPVKRVNTHSTTNTPDSWAISNKVHIPEDMVHTIAIIASVRLT